MGHLNSRLVSFLFSLSVLFAFTFLWAVASEGVHVSETKLSLKPADNVERTLVNDVLTSSLGTIAKVEKRKRNPRVTPLLKNWEIKTFKTRKSEDCHKVVPKRSSRSYPQVLKKRAFSDRERFVFIVGLEGAGHHLFGPLLQNCTSCEPPEMVEGSSLCAHGDHTGIFATQLDEDELDKTVTTFVRGFNYNNLRHKYEGDGSPKTFMLNTIDQNISCGQMSYPNFLGKCREVQYPDVRILADIFEHFSIDFRVVVIIRNAIDILLSTSVHRHYGRWEYLSQMYADLMEEVILKQQLLRLDSKFIKCMDYDALPYIPTDVGDHMNVNNGGYLLEEEIKKIFRKSEDDSDRDQLRKHYMQMDTQQGYVRLQKAINELRQLCKTL